ncbi:hypothetical protein [Acidiphilium multivorum]|nr:hypothetical protein [Acidiphilium multivorum]
MHTDAYLQITFPGMSDWIVEEIHGQDGTLERISTGLNREGIPIGVDF